MTIDVDKVILNESSGDPLKYNPNSGARGIMQVTPIALQDWNQIHPNRQYGLRDLFNEQINMEVGKWYLQKRVPELLKSKGTPVTRDNVLAGYNWGANAVSKWAGRKGRFEELPDETQDYLLRYEYGGQTGVAKKYQEALKEKGLYKGKIDGIVGAMTVGAIKRLQADNNLAPDGIIGKQTREALGFKYELK